MAQEDIADLSAPDEAKVVRDPEELMCESAEGRYEQGRTSDYLDFRRKLDEFKGATEGMVSESESLRKHGNAYFTFGCYCQATIMYSDALELQPHSAVLYCNRAMAYLKQDMPELALDDSIKSLWIDSSVTNIKGYWRKAQALFDLNRYEESEQAAGDGLEIQSRNPQLNKVRKKAREATVTNRLVAGDWVGMSNGLEQRLSFTKDGDMTMTVFGHRLPSTYELSVEGNPRSMLVKMKQEIGPGSPPPMPPMVYIIEFHEDDKELWMCHPVDGSKDLPTKFEGPGFVRAHLVEPEADAVPSTEPLEKRCADYMREMNKVMPLMPAQLPEKPDDEQIKEEVELCGRISELKRKYGIEVHQCAVALAKAPSTAESEELKDLAEQMRRRFLARKLIEEPPKAKTPASAQAVPPTAAAEVADLPIVAARSSSSGLLGRLASSICGGCGKAQ